MPPKKSTTLHVPLLQTESVTVKLLGRTGLYVHRMSAKARRVLLIGGRRKTAAERLELKHSPRDEFKEALHLLPGVFPETDVVLPSVCFKRAMATAALTVPGINKTDVQRLVYIPGEYCPIWGIPKLRMDVVRQAGMARTPDIRTRPYFENWASEITVEYAVPALSAAAILALLTNAGIVSGVGDYRQEKGAGSYGTFVPVDEIPLSVVMDLKRQREAIAEPQPSNIETAELLADFDAEVESRSAAAATRKAKTA